MTLLAERQKLVAANIANADTPGYRTKDLDFQTEFQSALQDQSHSIVEPEGLETKADGNNVNIDREARLLAENTMRFSIAANFAKGELTSLKNAIQEGRS